MDKTVTLDLRFTYLEVLQVYILKTRDGTVDYDGPNFWFSQSEELIEPLGEMTLTQMLESFKGSDWTFTGVVTLEVEESREKLTWLFVRVVSPY